MGGDVFITGSTFDLVRYFDVDTMCPKVQDLWRLWNVIRHVRDELIDSYAGCLKDMVATTIEFHFAPI